MMMYTRILLGISTLLTFRIALSASIREEPSCYSRFDYEEKLLEKMIRTELQTRQVLETLDTAMNKIQACVFALACQDATNLDFAENLLENTVRTELQIQQALETLKTAINTIQDHRVQIDKIKANLESSVELKAEAVSKKLEHLQQQMDTYKGIAKTPSIAFNVREAVDQSPSAGQIMLFKTVVLNTGNAYNTRTGIFTSPVNGTYIFHVQICTNFRENGSVKVVSGDTVLLGISNYNYISGITGTSGSAAQILAEGQMVWVVNEYDSTSAANLIDSDHERACWNQFSGVLVELNVDH